MVNRNELVDNLKNQLDQWNKKITELEDKAKLASENVKNEVNTKLEQTVQQRQNLEKRIEEAKGASEDKLNEIVSNSEKALSEIKDGFEKASAHFKS